MISLSEISDASVRQRLFVAHLALAGADSRIWKVESEMGGGRERERRERRENGEREERERRERGEREERAMWLQM
jgi:hypothetical protein